MNPKRWRLMQRSTFPRTLVCAVGMLLLVSLSLRTVVGDDQPHEAQQSTGADEKAASWKDFIIKLLVADSIEVEATETVSYFRRDISDLPEFPLENPWEAIARAPEEMKSATIHVESWMSWQSYDTKMWRGEKHEPDERPYLRLILRAPWRNKDTGKSTMTEEVWSSKFEAPLTRTYEPECPAGVGSLKTKVNVFKGLTNTCASAEFYNSWLDASPQTCSFARMFIEAVRHPALDRSDAYCMVRTADYNDKLDPSGHYLFHEDRYWFDRNTGFLVAWDQAMRDTLPGKYETSQVVVSRYAIRFPEEFKYPDAD